MAVAQSDALDVGLFGLWGVILFRLSDSVLLDSLLLAGGIIATGTYFWWVRATQRFATENPSLALLEGAEFPARLLYKEQTADVQ